MKKNLYTLIGLFLLTSFFTVYSKAQVDSKSSTGLSDSDNDIWFIAVVVHENDFPQENFSLANADHFIQSVQTWISSDPSRYQTTVLPVDSSTDILVLKRSDYLNLPEDSRLRLKEWVTSINHYFTMQDNYQIDQTKRYLLSSADFDVLKSIVK